MICCITQIHGRDRNATVKNMADVTVSRGTSPPKIRAVPENSGIFTGLLSLEFYGMRQQSQGSDGEITGLTIVRNGRKIDVPELAAGQAISVGNQLGNNTTCMMRQFVPVDQSVWPDVS